MKKILFVLCLISFNTYATENTISTESDFSFDFKNRFSLMGGVNSSLTKSADLTNFTASYGRQLETLWIDTNLLITQGLFHEMSENHVPATGATDDQLAEQKNTLTSVGVGVGRETRYAQTLLPLKDIYEFMAANLTYNMYKEDFSGKSFSGPGLLAKFAVYKRFGDYFSAGAHFNYILAVVKRSQDNDQETSSDRSLTLGFVTLGFNLNFYL